jgi:hypothetical protein
MTDTVTVASRFRGPPNSGNGGYVCGRVAAFVAPLVGGAAEVTLMKPPPLDHTMAIVAGDDGGIAMVDGEDQIAGARPAPLDLDVPAALDFEEASIASARYDRFDQHPFPTCFVCGPAREPGDGLRIFAGDAGEGGMVAAPWTPHPSLADAGGRIGPEFVWAVLDCPGAYAVLEDDSTPAVLGRLTAQVYGTPEVGGRHVVIGWPIGADGRKLFAGTALFTAEGELLGAARAIWIVPKSA